MEQGGRPPFFNSSDDLQSKIDEYFATGVKKKKIKVGKPPKEIVIEIPVPTITGLCIFLGFESRQSFYAYEQKDGFSYTIKRARLFIENEYEELLQTGNTTGAIFALKNFGWVDKQEIDQKTEHSGSIAHTIDHSKLSDAALREIAGLDKPKEG